MRKKIIKYVVSLFLIVLIITTGIEDVYASYDVTVDGVAYVCTGKSEGSGFGYSPRNFPSAKEAKKFCESLTDYYRDSTVYVFKSKCTFDKNKYDCNCNTITYENCVQKDPNQKPTYATPKKAIITFFDEFGKEYTKETCETSTSDSCDITLPYYVCQNGYFAGWTFDTSVGQGCNSGFTYGQPGNTIGHQIPTSIVYFSYAPCCVSGNTTSTTPTPSSGNNNATPANTPSQGANTITPTNTPASGNVPPSSPPNEEPTEVFPSFPPSEIVPSEPTEIITPVPTITNNTSEKDKKELKLNSTLIISFAFIAILLIALSVCIYFIVKNKKNAE